MYFNDSLKKALKPYDYLQHLERTTFPMVSAKKEKHAVWVPGFHALGWAVPANVDTSRLTEIGGMTTTLRPKANVTFAEWKTIGISQGSTATDMPKRTWSSCTSPPRSMSIKFEKGRVYVKGDTYVIYACFCHPRHSDAATEAKVVCRQWKLPTITVRWKHFERSVGYVRVIMFSGNWKVEEK